MSFNGKSVRALAHDYETTGVDAATCGVLQSALWIVTLNQDGSYSVEDKDLMLLNPGKEIHPEASKIHGYYAHDLVDELPWEQYLGEQMETVNSLGLDAVIGFNSTSFDNRIASRVGFKAPASIDLMKAARKLKTEHKWPSAKLVHFYEYLMGEPMNGAHDASVDVDATMKCFKPLLGWAKVDCLDELMVWMKGDEGTLDMKIGFGKHKGSKIKNLDKPYCKWLLSDDCEMLFSAELHLALTLRLAQPV
jgi:hypothetical protein